MFSLCGWASDTPAEELDAYRLWVAAKLTNSQPWTLCGEPPSMWWAARAIAYERARREAETTLRELHADDEDES